MAERADLVVVGAGTIGGWASVFAKAEGLGRVVVVERGLAGMGASSRAAGIVRAQGGTPATVALGRWSIDFYNGQQAAYGTDSGFRELGYLILAVTDEDERAGRERVAMQQAEGLAVRWLDAAEAARRGGHARTGRSSRRELHRDRRRHRSAAQRPRLRARDAGGGGGAARAHGIHRAPHRPDRGRQPGHRGGDGRRRHRDRAGPADRRSVAPVGRPAGRPADPGRSRSPHGRRPRAEPGLRRPAHADGLRHRRRACTGGSRRAASSSAGATPTSRRARTSRSTGRSRSGCGRGWRRSCPRPAGLALRRIWAATIDYTPDHLPILGPALTPDGARVEGVTVASAGGHGMMWGPGVARVAADLVTRGETDVIDVARARPRPLRRRGPEPPRERPDRAAVPGRRGLAAQQSPLRAPMRRASAYAAIVTAGS